VQLKEFESPMLLPTLEALDAEFGCEDQQCIARRRKQEGASMEAEFTTELRAARPLNPMKQSSSEKAIMRPSLARRALRRLARFLIVFCVGVGTALLWQSYGDAARAMIANSSPQLGWLAPQTVSVVPSAPDAAGPASSVLLELEQLALGLAAVRQSVDQFAAQLAAGQRQMEGDIAKLQADAQEIFHKVSAAPARPTTAPAHKPVSVTSSAVPLAQR
jgi:hypothetical protein